MKRQRRSGSASACASAHGVPDSACPRVLATILFWSERELPLVERCVDSLLAQSGSADLRVMVIDNGSGLTPRLPVSVELLRLPANLGFAGGHNAGIRAALEEGTQFVFLVNSDVVVASSCLGALIEATRNWPNIGILGPLVLSERSAGHIESNGQSFNSWTGRHRERGRGLAISSVDMAPHSVDSVSGCALLASRAMLDRVGFLDEDLYLYFEDLDWCLRASRAGFVVGVVPQAVVWHIGAGSTGPGWPGRTYYSVRNHTIVAARYAQGPLAWLLPALVLAYHLAFLIRSRDYRTGANLLALLRGAFAACTLRTGRRWGTCA